MIDYQLFCPSLACEALASALEGTA